MKIKVNQEEELWEVALPNGGSLILTERLIKEYFGDSVEINKSEPPVGMTIGEILRHNSEFRNLAGALDLRWNSTYLDFSEAMPELTEAMKEEMNIIVKMNEGE